MKWCLFDFLHVLFLLFSIYSDGVVTAENKHYNVYKNCMKQFGIEAWKIVDSATNATYYDIYNFQWNKYFETVYPIAIFVPSSVSDVQSAVKCGFKSNIQLVPNSGAHSYAGLSSGTNSSIIIDFRHMTAIEINEKEQSVTVGPGALVGHLHSKLWKNGEWGTVLGLCMTVALGGHSIGGGVGYFSSLYGLVIDNILEITLVDARGNAVTANPTHNTDLWWAMRGVGPGYIGILTSVKLKIFKAKHLTLTFTRIRYQVKDFQNVIGNYTLWLDWVKQNEPSIMSIIYVVNDNYSTPNTPVRPGIEVQLLHIQDLKLQPNSNKAFLQAFPKFFQNTIEVITRVPSYPEFIIATSYTPVVSPRLQLQNSTSDQTQSTQNMASIIDSKLDFFSTLTKEMAVPRYFFAKSFFVNKRFRSEQLNELQKVMNEIPNNTNGIQINSEQGAVGIRRSNASSYFHRNSLFNVRLFYESLNVDGLAAGKKWADNFMKVTKFMDSGETYQNYPDCELKDYLFRYYGSNLNKLIQIKKKWDPCGYFDSRMSIPTTFLHALSKLNKRQC